MKTPFIKISFLFVLFVLLYTPPVHAFKRTLIGDVTEVKNGDTIVIAPVDGTPFLICRLYGINAPETALQRFGGVGQPYGEEAKTELKRLILGQTVDIITTGEETYCHCLIRKEGMDINREMVRRGYAWAYKDYGSEYIIDEQQARKRRRGLWQKNNPEPPWEFRQRNRVY